MIDEQERDLLRALAIGLVGQEICGDTARASSVRDQVGDRNRELAKAFDAELALVTSVLFDLAGIQAAPPSRIGSAGWLSGAVAPSDSPSA